jgi:hypothetical protein
MLHINEDEGRESCGGIIRDLRGKFVAAACTMILFVADSMMAEAYAPREGLCLAQHIGCKKIIIQSDNSQVIDIMLDGGFTTTIFNDCIIITLGFNQVEFQHCQREANSVTHKIARNSFQVNLSCISNDDPPSFVLPFL